LIVVGLGVDAEHFVESPGGGVDARSESATTLRAPIAEIGAQRFAEDVHELLRLFMLEADQERSVGCRFVHRLILRRYLHSRNGRANLTTVVNLNSELLLTGLTTEETARVLGTTDTTIRNWLAAGKLTPMNCTYQRGPRQGWIIALGSIRQIQQELMVEAARHAQRRSVKARVRRRARLLADARAEERKLRGLKE
jgi:hypothetical protein